MFTYKSRKHVVAGVFLLVLLSMILGACGKGGEETKKVVIYTAKENEEIEEYLPVAEAALPDLDLVVHKGKRIAELLGMDGDKIFPWPKNPKNGFIDFPGGLSKFTIRYDRTLDKYLTLSNAGDDPEYPCRRNILSLCASDDLRHWTVVRVLLRDESGLEWENSKRLTGFQYVDWQFDNDDIIYLVRMAWRGAHNFHDANRITYHVLRNYRELFTAK